MAPETDSKVDYDSMSTGPGSELNLELHRAGQKLRNLEDEQSFGGEGQKL